MNFVVVGASGGIGQALTMKLAQSAAVRRITASSRRGPVPEKNSSVAAGPGATALSVIDLPRAAAVDRDLRSCALRFELCLDHFEVGKLLQQSAIDRMLAGQ